MEEYVGRKYVPAYYASCRRTTQHSTSSDWWGQFDGVLDRIAWSCFWLTLNQVCFKQ